VTPSFPFTSSTPHRNATTHPCLLLPYIPAPSAWITYCAIRHIDANSVWDPIEVCALKLDSTFLNICILVIYRSPVGNFNTQLDNILQKLCTIKSNLIICGDVNVNYLQESDKMSQLNARLNLYHLLSIVQFPTRTYKNSISAIDNIFIDTTKIDTYEVIPKPN
jgi:hypothetical protein